jgi:hypothetical protein
MKGAQGLTRWGSLCVAAVAIAFLGAVPAHATLLFSVGSVSAAAGTSGAFDVTLQNTGVLAVNIAAFSFGLSVGTTDITFTGVNTSTASTYIFNGNSLFGPLISTTPPPTGQIVLASDVTANALDFSLASGATVGIGHVLFDLSLAAALGPQTVTLAVFPTTSLSDSLGANVAFTGSNGILTITAPAATPEPSTFLLTLLGLPVFAWVRRKRFR